MRKFNNREKELIKRLAKIEIGEIPSLKKFLIDNWFNEESQRALFIDHTKGVVFYFYEIQLEYLESRKQIFEFFEVITLLDYLSDHRYINVVKEDYISSPYEMLFSKYKEDFIKKDDKIVFENGDYILIEKQPHLILNKESMPVLNAAKIAGHYKFICNGIDGAVFPTEELIDLERHNFRTKEDRKHNRQLLATWISIFIAFLFGVTGIYLTYFC